MAASPDIACIWPGEATLGECPVWDARDDVLWFVDCHAPAVHRFDPALGDVQSWPLERRIHSIGLRARGGLVAAMERGVFVLDPKYGVETCGIGEPLADPVEPRADHHFNDGKCGPDGRLWAGAMHRSYREPTGRLYRIGADGAAQAMLDGLTVPNGLGWSPDGARFYLADSPTGTIRQFAFDTFTGALGPPERFAGPESAPGWPDGLAVDAEGFVWNARWDGGCIARFDPGGRLDRTVAMPVTRPTSCAFGGPRLQTLYVTSARIGLDEAALAGQPLAGALFGFEPGVAGAPVGLFEE